MTSSCLVAFRWKLFFSVISLLTISTQAHPAEVAWHKIDKESHDQQIGIVLFQGRIEAGDAAQVLDEILSASDEGVLIVGVVLVSPGGNVAEGLAIGRLLRENRLIAISPSRKDTKLNASDCQQKLVPRVKISDEFVFGYGPALNPCICASACALAWIGGVARVGTVGLHHHFLSDGTMKFDQFEFNLKTWGDKITEYFDYVRAPLEFREIWFGTASTDLNLVGQEDDADTYEFDQIFREYLISECGSFPPDDASTYRRQQANRYEKGNMNAGEVYAYELLANKLDSHHKCTESAIIGAISNSQAIE